MGVACRRQKSRAADATAAVPFVGRGIMLWSLGAFLGCIAFGTFMTCFAFLSIIAMLLGGETVGDPLPR